MLLAQLQTHVKVYMYTLINQLICNTNNKCHILQHKPFHMDFRNLLLFPNILAKIIDLLPTEEINKPLPYFLPLFSDILYKFN